VAAAVEGEEVRFASDSPLEGTGFELSVPREIGLGYEALSFICRHKSWRSAKGTHSARGTSTATDVGRASQEGGLRFGLCRDRQGTASPFRRLSSRWPIR
jgi:hypothetical protein